MTHSRVGLGRIVERHARVKALARAHLSSASPFWKVPRAMVLPAHYNVSGHHDDGMQKCVSDDSDENGGRCERKTAIQSMNPLMSYPTD